MPYNRWSTGFSLRPRNYLTIVGVQALAQYRSISGETTCFITRSVSEEIQKRGDFLAHASGYEGRLHA